MTDFIETLWSQFAVETEEHIETIELNLVRAEQEGASPEVISSLFRAFHSLKGLANAMDMVSFGRVAHRAEDILGVIRDGVFPLNSDVVSLLLAALDEIKVLQREAVTSQMNREADPEVMRHLNDSFSTMHHVTDVAGEEREGAARVETAAPEQYAERPLSEDPDMLAYFIELTKEQIPVLSGVLEPFCRPGDEQVEGDGLARLPAVAASIDQLVHAATVMEFHSMADTMRQLRSALPTRIPVTDEERSTITECLRQLHDQILYLEQTTGARDVGARQLYHLLKEAMDASLQAMFQTVLDDLDALQLAYGEGDTLDLAIALHSHLAALNSHLTFFLQSTTCSIILMLEDVFGRAARGELHIFSEIIELARTEINHVFECYRSCATVGRCTCDHSDITESIQKIHEYIWAYESGSGTNNPVEAFRRFMAGLRIEPELVKILSPDNVRDLMRSFELGEHVYELLAHLESDELIAAAFLGWVESSGSRVITNRSIFIDGQSWYEMLLVSPHAREEIEKRLKEMDATGTFLLLKSGDDGIPEKAELMKSLESVPVAPVAATSATAASGGVIRVRGDILDGFMNQIGEMVLARSRLNHIIHNERLTVLIGRLKQNGGAGADLSDLLDLLMDHRRELVETDLILNNALGRLQENAVRLRVVPVEMVFKRLPRIVRDLAQVQGKRVLLEMSGQDVKIDKAMVDILSDPLIHMVRNSVDHGIEEVEAREAKGKHPEAVIRVSALQQGNSIVITVSDNGRGVDTERVLMKAVERGLVQEEAARSLTRDDVLRFVLLPGFSTATMVTETSGRGVGLDVVMTNVMRMGGTIAIESEPDRGTTFTLRMPLSAAIQEVLMVEAAGQTLALPGRYVSEVLEIGSDDTQTIRGERAILLRGAFLPLHRLATLLGYAGDGVERRDRIAVVLTNGSQRIGVVVDKVVRRQELFTKDIQDSVAGLPGVGGASILGNGRVVLILEGEELLQIARSGLAGVRG